MMVPKVKLVAMTQPCVPECDTPEDFVAYCARVSNPDNQHNKETSGKLLKYLKDNAHWSPFEMVHIVMEIETTRDIARQMLRHRSFAFQEFSQRYADVNLLEDTFVTRECRLQDHKNRQNSISFNPEDSAELMDIYQAWQEQQEETLEVCQRNYQSALENGIAKEQARALLPEGLTKSRLYMAGSLRSWIHYCELRTKESGSQKEHYEISEMCKNELEKVFPTVFKKETS